MPASRSVEDEDAVERLGSATRARWVAVAPKPGDPELHDEEIPFPLEPPHITALRQAKGGPYYLAPDSTEPVPPEIWDGIDANSVIKQAERSQKHNEDAGSNAPLRRDDRDRLKQGNQAAQLLLTTLDRGLEATTPELDEAVKEKLRKQGLE
jgi:hypothetical protein